MVVHCRQDDWNSIDQSGNIDRASGAAAAAAAAASRKHASWPRQPRGGSTKQRSDRSRRGRRRRVSAEVERRRIRAAERRGGSTGAAAERRRCEGQGLARSRSPPAGGAVRPADHSPPARDDARSPAEQRTSRPRATIPGRFTLQRQRQPAKLKPSYDPQQTWPPSTK